MAGSSIENSYLEVIQQLNLSYQALNKFILLSNINVHREQITHGVDFFDPNNPAELSKKLEYYWNHPVPEVSHDYASKRREFGQNFMKFAQEAKRI